MKYTRWIFEIYTTLGILMVYAKYTQKYTLAYTRFVAQCGIIIPQGNVNVLSEVKIRTFHKSGFISDYSFGYIFMQLCSHFFLLLQVVYWGTTYVTMHGSLLATSPHICLSASAPLIWAILSLYVMTRAGVTPPIGGLVVLTPSVVKVVRTFCFLAILAKVSI